ncbi:MAG TPA: ABC transporter substrate-binding protein [Xanthobacteraceae bacterium]|nr:ABC transporter substrate-binding protein [Xanthobacteraceae bacterium]
MRRRDLISLLGAAAVWPLGASAQERMRRIAMLVGATETDPEAPLSSEAFRQTLNQLGWKEGVNVRIDTRWGDGDPDRIRAYAKELIGTAPDVAVADSTPAALALQRESRTTPTIFIQAGNPVGSGLVANLARPGGNLTGFTNYVPSMGGKWLELLKEVAPRLGRVAALFNPKTHTGQYWDVLEAATQSLGLTFSKAAVEDESGIARAVEAMGDEPAGGLIVMPDSFTMSHRETIIALAARHRVPTVYPFRVFSANGGLMSYGMSRVGVYRDAASYVDRVLRGEKPGNLPVQAPTKFELVVNLKTAKALGLDIPPKLLALADEVIE